MPLNSCKTVFSHKGTQQFLRQNTPDSITADDGHHSPDLNPLDYCIWDILQDLVYDGRQLLFANLQDLKEAIKNKWKEVTIETVHWTMDKWLNAVRKQNGGALQPLIAVTGYTIDLMHETSWTYWLFCTFRTSNTFAYFTVKTKAYNVIISHTVHLWLLLFL